MTRANVKVAVFALAGFLTSTLIFAFMTQSSQSTAYRFFASTGTLAVPFALALYLVLRLVVPEIELAETPKRAMCRGGSAGIVTVVLVAVFTGLGYLGYLAFTEPNIVTDIAGILVYGSVFVGVAVAWAGIPAFTFGAAAGLCIHRSKSPMRGWS